MEIQNINLNGYIPSTPDRRNYRLDMYERPYQNDPLPEYFELVNLPPVLDQKSSGMCVAFTLSAVKTYQEEVERDEVLQFSPGFIYAHKAFPSGEGMIPKVALNRLRDLGTVYFDDFDIIGDADVVIEEFNRYKSTFESEEEMYEYSRINKTKSYAELKGEREIKEALMEGHLVAVGARIIRNFYYPDSGFIKYEDGAKIYGGHMFFIYGWNKHGWLIQNSWGTDWGLSGRAVLDYNYPLLEAWALFDHTPLVPLDAEYKVELQKDNPSIIINDEKIVELRVPPMFEQYSNKYSALMVPVREFFEATGHTVKWDAEENRAIIYK